MKVVALNGSPRKNWNTAILLNKGLEGAASQGAETELIQLGELCFSGCISCFACKLKNGKSYAKCGVKDELTPILDKIPEVDAFILGAPIYLGAVNSRMQAFFERLIFPFLSYGAGQTTLFPKKIKTGFIYTLGATEERMKQVGYDRSVILNQMLLERIFGTSESLLVNDTYQFDDYSKFETSGINIAEKTRIRKEVFPGDCRKAYEMGVRLVNPAPPQ